MHWHLQTLLLLCFDDFVWLSAASPLPKLCAEYSDDGNDIDVVMDTCLDSKRRDSTSPRDTAYASAATRSRIMSAMFMPPLQTWPCAAKNDSAEEGGPSNTTLFKEASVPARSGRRTMARPSP